MKTSLFFIALMMSLRLFSQTGDTCNDAMSITFDTNLETPKFSIDYTEYTESGIYPSCNEGASRDVWFYFTMPIDGNIKVTDMNMGTQVVIYSGTCENLTLVSCNITNPGYGFELTAETTYYVQSTKKGFFPNNDFNFKLSVHPINDNLDCSSAEVITFNGNHESALISEDSDHYSPSGVKPNCEFDIPIDAWYSFTMPINGNLKVYNVYTGNSIAIYSGSCGTLIAQSCSADDPSYGFELIAGQTYFIQVWRHGSQGGSIEFQLAAFPVNPNLDCATAQAITFDANHESSLITVDSDQYTPSGMSPDCESGDPIDAWFQFTMPVNGNVKFNNISLRTEISLYSGSCGNLLSEICSSLRPSYAYALNAGETYYIQAWKNSSQGSQIEFKVTVHGFVANDECTNAREVIFDQNNESQIILEWDGATVSNDIATCQDSDEPDAWYTMTSPINGTYRFSNTSGFRYAIYEKNSLNCSGNELNCNIFNQSFNVVQGGEYIIRIWRYSGHGDLSFELLPTTTPISNFSGNSCFSNSTTQSIPNIIINNSNNRNWVLIQDDNQDVVAAINANGNNLGEVSTSLFNDNLNDFLIYSKSPDQDVYYLRRFLNIEVENQPSTPVDVRIYISRSEFNDLQSIDNTLNDVDDLVMYKISNQDCSQTFNGESGETIFCSNSLYDGTHISLEFQVQQFSKFLMMSDQSASALPISLMSYSTTEHQGKAKLQWITASETSNKGFHIQHSINGQIWTTIGWVNGAGTSLSENTYEYIHEFPAMGPNFYRLQQVDFSGKSEFSPIRQLHISAKEQFVVSPNPASEVFSIPFETPGLFNLKILNANGKLEHEVQNYNSREEVHIKGLSKGMYFILLTNDNETITRKIIKS